MKLLTAGNPPPTLEAAYLEHRSRVYGICLRMLKNAEDAEDLTSEVFLHLQKKLDTFRGESSFTTWLHRLTVNQVLMWLRKHKKRTDKTESIEPDDTNDPIHELEAPPSILILDNLALEGALNDLPDGYKKILLLHDVAGYDHAEVSEIVGVSIGTSKSQLHKAREKMKSLLNKKANPRVHVSPILLPPSSTNGGSTHSHIHEKLRRHGTDPDGSARWVCGCGKTFTDRTADIYDGRMAARKKKGEYIEPHDKYSRRAAKLRTEGRCTRCGKPCAPYANCADCRIKKQAHPGTRQPVTAEQVVSICPQCGGPKKSEWSQKCRSCYAMKIVITPESLRAAIDDNNPLQSVADIAERLGTSSATIYNRMRDDPALREVWKIRDEICRQYQEAKIKEDAVLVEQPKEIAARVRPKFTCDCGKPRRVDSPQCVECRESVAGDDLIKPDVRVPLRRVELRGGGFVLLGFEGDYFALQKQGRRLLNELANECDDYEKRAGLYA
jgi:RNA polymerase sigma-70 factor (ECF subfamily)